MVFKYQRLICLEKRRDTVGQPQSAENCVWHMPSLQAQEPGESEVIAIVVSRGNRLTNSIRRFFETRPQSLRCGPATLLQCEARARPSVDVSASSPPGVGAGPASSPAVAPYWCSSAPAGRASHRPPPPDGLQ